MKLNYRDKVLLTTVIVVLVWVAGIMLFIKPAIEDVNTAQSSLDEATVSLSDLQNQIEQDKDLQRRIDKSYSDVTKLSANFYDYQLTQDATQTVDDLLTTDSISNTDMKISAYESKILAPFTYESTQVSTDIDNQVKDYDNGTVTTTTDTATTTTSDANASPDLTIGNYTITVSFKGAYTDVQNFCEKLTSNTEKSLVINSLKIDDVTADQVEGTMELNMMVLSKLSDPNSTTAASE